MKPFWIALLFFPVVLCAATVRLANDTVYRLRAKILGSDGTSLGEMVVSPQQTLSWNDYSTQEIGFYSGSRTPFTVFWYCEDGRSFSVCNQVSTGSTVTATGCPGPHACEQLKKHPPKPEPYTPRSEYVGPPEGQLE